MSDKPDAVALANRLDAYAASVAEYSSACPIVAVADGWEHLASLADLDEIIMHLRFLSPTGTANDIAEKYKAILAALRPAQTKFEGSRLHIEQMNDKMEWIQGEIEAFRKLVLATAAHLREAAPKPLWLTRKRIAVHAKLLKSDALRKRFNNAKPPLKRREGRRTNEHEFDLDDVAALLAAEIGDAAIRAMRSDPEARH